MIHRNMVREKDKFPSIPHLAAVVFSTESVYTPGYDERESGYYSSVKRVDYVVFNTEQEMKDWIIKAETSKTETVQYKLIKAHPIQAQLKTEVQFT